MARKLLKRPRLSPKTNRQPVKPIEHIRNLVPFPKRTCAFRNSSWIKSYDHFNFCRKTSSPEHFFFIPIQPTQELTHNFFHITHGIPNSHNYPINSHQNNQGRNKENSTTQSTVWGQAVDCLKHQSTVPFRSVD